MDQNQRAERLQQLLREGRKILTMPSGNTIEAEFSRWENAAADWLDNFFPGQHLSGQWIALEAEDVQSSLARGDSDDLKRCTRKRIEWLAKTESSKPRTQRAAVSVESLDVTRSPAIVIESTSTKVLYEDAVPKKRQCFVLMPFAEKFFEVYEGVFKPVCQSNGLSCWRVD